MSDYVKVDWQALEAAKMKMRRVIIDAERGKANLHAAYKLGQFLTEALGDAWKLADAKVPDTVPED